MWLYRVASQHTLWRPFQVPITGQNMFTCVNLGSFICNSFYNLLKWKLKYCFCGVNLKSSGTRTVEQMQSRMKIHEGLLPVTCLQCFHLKRIAEASTPFGDQAAADLQFPTQSQFADGCWHDLWPCGSTGACSDTWVSWGANPSPWPLQPGRVLWAWPCTQRLQTFHWDLWKACHIVCSYGCSGNPLLMSVMLNYTGWWINLCIWGLSNLELGSYPFFFQLLFLSLLVLKWEMSLLLFSL